MSMEELHWKILRRLKAEGGGEGQVEYIMVVASFLESYVQDDDTRGITRFSEFITLVRDYGVHKRPCNISMHELTRACGAYWLC